MVGVTGHRDLDPAGIAAVRREFADKAKALAQTCNSVPLVLLTGMAEGADQLAADEAMKLGWPVIAALPLPLADYQTDFAEGAPRDRLHELLGRCARVITVPYASDPAVPDRRDQAYRNLGRFIVEHAQAVVALWNGEEGDAPGGTAEVVSFCLGAMPPSTGLQIPRRVPVIQVRTPRLKTPGKTVAVVAEQTVELGAIAARIADFNRQLSPAGRDELPRGIAPGTRMQDEDQRRRAPGIEVLSEAFRVADAGAMRVQAQRNRLVRTIMGLGVTGAACFGAYAIGHGWQWIVAFLAIAGIATLIHARYFLGKERRIEDRNHELRAFAELLRVQIHWAQAGVPDRAAHSYSCHLRGSREWFCDAAANLGLQIEPQPGQTTASLAAIRDSWLKSQSDYFGRASARDGLSAERLGLLSRTLLYAGIGVAAVTVGAQWLGAGVLVLDFLVLGAAVLFSLAAAVQTWLELMSYEELAVRYRRMGELYGIAVKRFDAAGDDESRRQILLEAGEEALEENADWLLLHRQHKYSVRAA